MCAGHHPVHQPGQAQHGQVGPAAFLGVGVQQRRAGLRVRRPPGGRGSEGELPAEVDGVVDAEVHALRSRRRVGVRGVPGQEQRAPTEPARDPVLQRHLGRPRHGLDTRAQPALVEQPL
jgi:hypothetical protein